MDGEEFRFDNGFWTKFEVHHVIPGPHIPHGVRYSLTLHDRHNQRVLGYDNAHAVDTRRPRFAARRLAWDHIHRQNRVTQYTFKSAGQLLEDFWSDVNRIIEAENKP